ncbi:hypothetical protein [Isoptericola nanjingensis]|uniref:hypothetical protein n=1 Tax=Isoptericola TaxID=254250 RepID=UPI00378DE832
MTAEHSHTRPAARPADGATAAQRADARHNRDRIVAAARELFAVTRDDLALVVMADSGVGGRHTGGGRGRLAPARRPPAQRAARRRRRAAARPDRPGAAGVAQAPADSWCTSAALVPVMR